MGSLPRPLQHSHGEVARQRLHTGRPPAAAPRHGQRGKRRRPAKPLASAAAVLERLQGAAEQQQQQQRPQLQPVQIPASLRNQVCRLAVRHPETGQESEAFLLGMSHVSEASCRDAEQLIELVRPSIVLTEVCRERVGMLLPHKRPARGFQARRTLCMALSANACLAHAEPRLL